MEVLYERCCGLDMHKKFIIACLLTPGPTGRPQKELRTFGTMTQELLGLVTNGAGVDLRSRWQGVNRKEGIQARLDLPARAGMPAFERKPSGPWLTLLTN
jgi:hypothetical protein